MPRKRKPIPVKVTVKRKKDLDRVNAMKAKKHNVFPTTSLTIKEELDFLKKVLRKYRSKIDVAVELGCYAGGTSVEILAALKNTATLYCVDSFVVNGEDARAVFTEQVLPRLKNIELIEKPVHDAAPEFNRSIDFLLVDADHQDHSIQEDCADWLPKIRSGGIVAFHDYEHPHFPCIAPRVEEVTKDWKKLGVEGHLMIKIKP